MKTRPQPVFPGITFRWLGVAGIEITTNDQVLAIDPFFTRPSIWKLLLGHLEPNSALVSKNLPRCDHILVSHSHYDHLMDVPVIARLTGAQVYGSANTCQLLEIMGVPQKQVHRVHSGMHLTLGDFEIDVCLGKHIVDFLHAWINGQVRSDLKPPLHFLDYKMDEYYCFSINYRGLRLLHGEHNSPADVLFAKPFAPLQNYQPLLDSVQPKLLVLIHWDDFFRPLEKRLRISYEPPAFKFPPLQRLNLVRLEQVIKEISSQTRVLIPEINKAYTLNEYVRDKWKTP